MTPNRTPARAAKTWALLAATLLALGLTGALATHDLAVESGQARAYVSQGTTALAKGDKASATLSFERARLLAPRADFVRSALSDSGVPALGSPVARAAGWLTPREWSSLAVAFGWIAGLSLAVCVAFGPSRTRRRLAGPLALCSGLGFVLSMGGVLESNVASRALAVVTGPAGALVAPYEAAGATADLPVGAVVIVGERYRDFVQVLGRDGVRGWVPSRVLQSIVDAGT